MFRAPLLSLAIVVSVGVNAGVRSAEEDKPTEAAKEYQELLKEYEEDGNPRAFGARFIAFAEQYADEPEAVDALLWVVKQLRSRPDASKAIELLQERHLESEQLGPAATAIAGVYSATAEELLRELVQRSPHQSVRAQACHALGVRLGREVSIVQQLTAEPDLAPRLLQYYGKDYGAHLSSLRVAELEQERERIYERMLKDFAEITANTTTYGKIAEKELFSIRHLSVGKPAPEIEGEDVWGKPFKLSDYRGKVVMISFWGHW